MDWFTFAHPVTQAALAGSFTWAITAAGAGLVLVSSRLNARLLGAMNGFAAGVMIAASFWSLLEPAIELSGGRGLDSCIPVVSGFCAGAAFLLAADRLVPHLHPAPSGLPPEGPRIRLSRSALVVLAITLHNVPEGLAVGVAYGAAAAGFPGATLPAAVALTLGIGLQNFPEGSAVAFPLRAEGMSAARAFWFGQASGIVEPVAAIAGAALVTLASALLPYALAFAAGAMVFVVVEELIPASHAEQNTDLATAATIAGFATMMALDVGLG